MATVRPARAIARGLRRRCPACGQAGLFRSWTDLHAECPRCRTDFDAGGEWTGAVMLTKFLVGFVAIFGALALLMLTQAPVWVQLAWVTVITTAFAIVAYPTVKGAWAGILVATRTAGRGRPPPRPPFEP